MRVIGDIGGGHTLGRYELLLPIAQGGMAVVWAARMKGSRGFQKIVAVKSMLPALSEDPDFQEMFLAEAEVASRIRHPNVCEILDLGEHDGTLYLVMEWIEGEPMSTLLKAARAEGRNPIFVPAKIAFHAAAGLHAAHELLSDSGQFVGLVHRDVSPQNILVTYGGVVKIVDFGVAKATAMYPLENTESGQVKGKIPFMSPEQALGKEVDRRTDIFALGIVLYQAITGKHPFRGDTDMATLSNICEGGPLDPPSRLRPECPASLDAVVMQALERDVTKRFQTMKEVARALERVLAEIGGDQDLGQFAREVLQAKADKRRAAIKEALRLADARAEKSAAVAHVLDVLSGEAAADETSSVSEVSHVSIASGASPPISGITGVLGPSRSASRSSATPSIGAVQVPEGTKDTPAAPSKRRRGALAAVAIALAIGVVGVFSTRNHRASSDVGRGSDGRRPVAAGGESRGGCSGSAR